MAYPVMYLVRDTKGKTLFSSKDREEAIKSGKELDSQDTEPLSLVQSQFIGWLDHL